MNTGARRRPFKYAAFDLDGTLLSEDGTVSGNTQEGLRRLKQEEISLIVVSGRSPYLVRQLGLPPRLLDLFEPIMVLRDGDILWNWTADSIEAMRTVPDTVVPALLTRGLTEIVVDTGRSLVAPSKRAALRYAFFYRCARSSITIADRPPSTPVTKITVYADHHEVRAALAGVEGCSISVAEEGGRCTVVPFGSCKTAGLARLMTLVYQEPTLTRVVAFGDGRNDACLLRSVGAGVAMAASDPAAARGATMQLAGTLATYLNEEFPRGLGDAMRPGHRCGHQP